jgi:hypothetical protein
MVARVLKAVLTPQKKNFLFTMKAKWIMLFVEMKAVYSERHNKYSP